MLEKTSSAPNADTINSVLSKTVDSIILNLHLQTTKSEAVSKALHCLRDSRLIYDKTAEGLYR